MAGLTACDSFFDLKPSNEMTLDEFWTSESDVLSVTGSCYRSMQESDFMKHYIMWSEFRSDNLIQGPSNGDDNIRNIANLNILPSNWYTAWSNFYNVINLCNTVEHFAPGVRDVDPNFTQSQLNAYLAEVKGVRALCYFTLVRTFRDIPFNTEVVVDDTQSFQLAQSDPDEVIDFLIDDLIKYEPMAAATYSNETYTKSRMSQAAIRALIADMCLWRGRYEECVTYCDKVLNDTKNTFTLESSMDYSRNLFVTGQSQETIFELYYNTTNYSNYAVADFYGESLYGYSQQMIPNVSDANTLSIFGETDLRGITSYYASSSRAASVRKYTTYLTAAELTAQQVNDDSYLRTNPYESNWIFYRLPDIYLMKAEALAEMGTNLQEAFNLACITYDRANPEAGTGSLSFSDYNSQDKVLNFIFDERQREFLYEGKRYFDILRRITHHREDFQNIVSTYLVPKYSDLDQSTVTSKLSSYDALFMPINDKELKANLLLKQNPFYRLSTDITQ